MIKKIQFLMLGLLLVTTGLFAEAEKANNESNATSTTSQDKTASTTSQDKTASTTSHGKTVNTTSLGKTSGSAEKYKLEVMAPLVDNNVFTVPVHYYDDLLTKNKKLPAVLLVPMRLTISNSRERRLLTIYTSNINEEIEFGTNLKNIIQVKLANKIIKDNNLTKFVGPNKKVFRTLSSDSTYVVDFIIPITQKNFHEGRVKVNIASSNGVQLTELCEIGFSDCVQTAEFTIVPRKVVYSSMINDTSGITTEQPAEKFSITQSNVDVEVEENNVLAETVSRKALPFELDVKYKKQKFNPNLTVETKYTSYVNNMDFFPVIHYMSNDSYKKGDVIVFTNSHTRPDLTIRNKEKAIELLAK
ncbi:hypothetical protein MNB_ARC-1_913 [hydrothermal vent metagenome]|uniref:Uncharacterized protein n=1 Tax=hydrothermal vent metagenome TaxID=652676 RepID=A0A3B1E434_9ZZZZ